jgi:GntR family transcriptional repressor for pyruvate dehydrogenase complex
MAKAEQDKFLTPVGGQSVVEMTISSIIDAIADGTYKSGQKLPNEYELISELQISRNSLREAMRVLSTVGVVEIKRGDGTYVCNQVNPSIIDNLIYGMVFDASSTEELIELRQSLDEVVLKLAIEKAEDEDIEELQKLIDKMQTECKLGNLEEAAKADYDFHIKLVDISSNTFLTRIVKGVYRLFIRSIQENISTEEEFASAVLYHKQLLNLVINRDKEKISDVVAASLESWQYHIK